MRITNKVLTRTYLANLNRNLENMSKLQNQQASGKELRRPSDSPFYVSRSIELNSSINRNSQYLRNIQDAQGWLKTTDVALEQIGNSLLRLNEIVNAAVNGTNSDTQLEAYKQEAIQVISGIAQSGNANYNGKYIFGGYSTTTPPFTDNGGGNVDSAGPSTEEIKREIAPGVVVGINVTADDINLGTPGSDLLKRIVDNLQPGHSAELSNLIGDIDDARDNILNLRAEIGAKMNRMDSAEKRNEEESYNMTEVLAPIEDIDVAEKAMQVNVAEAVYQASLMTGAKILQPTLLDFLG